MKARFVVPVALFVALAFHAASAVTGTVRGVLTQPGVVWVSDGSPPPPPVEVQMSNSGKAFLPGAVVVPLSSFDPQAIPDPNGKQVVFACRSGKRSVTASLAAQAAGLPYDKHLAGGMLAWKGAGLPTKSGG